MFTQIRRVELQYTHNHIIHNINFPKFLFEWTRLILAKCLNIRGSTFLRDCPDYYCHKTHLFQKLNAFIKPFLSHFNKLLILQRNRFEVNNLYT